MSRRNYCGIWIEGPFFATLQLIVMLKQLRENHPLAHNLIIQQTQSIQIKKEKTRLQNSALILHPKNLKSHPAWLTSWMVRFAAESLKIYTPQQMKRIQMNTLRRMTQQEREKLSFEDLQFLQRCANQLQ
ncbi:hypothetical protein J4457_05960 [Candidatus Woesearchaeota archaeon]|nr:hypothetical protein [Candidatus Woesearchaeota archaeon]